MGDCDFSALAAENVRLRAQLADLQQAAVSTAAHRQQQESAAHRRDGDIHHHLANSVVHWEYHSGTNCYPSRGTSRAFELSMSERGLDLHGCKQLCSMLSGCSGIVYGSASRIRCHPRGHITLSDCLRDHRYDVYVRTLIPRTKHLVLAEGARTPRNCSETGPLDSLCQTQGMHAETCDSMMTCSLTPGVRLRLLSEASPWWSRSEHTMIAHGRPDVRLLVPIRKLVLRAGSPTALEGSSAPELTLNDEATVIPLDASSDLTAAARTVSAAAALFKPWPARATFAEEAILWERFTEGERWRRCRPGSALSHWYCHHLSRTYFDDTLAIYDACIAPLGLFARDDVRLVLDLGGSTGAFAEALYTRHGERLSVVTSQLWAAENDDTYGHEFPQVGVLAARGFLGVMMDLYSFFPFGESSLDAIHTSWTYHNGLPLPTLYEIYRVLRPGGYLLLRQMSSTRGEASLANVRSFARLMNWTTILDRKGCHVGRAESHGPRMAGAGARHNYKFIQDTVMAYRMPMGV